VSLLAPPLIQLPIVEQAYAIQICRKLYTVLAPLKIYPALTGGCLFKDGPRKDVDIVLYRNRQGPLIDWKVLVPTLATIEVIVGAQYGFVTKAMYRGIPLDLFDPEAEQGEYE
jgi:hypothetical protein